MKNEGFMGKMNNDPFAYKRQKRTFWIIAAIAIISFMGGFWIGIATGFDGGFSKGYTVASESK